MDFYDFKNAFLIGFFMSFMIGPVFFMLIQTSILKGARAAISFNLGVIFGDLCFILIAYFGSKTLLEKIQNNPKLFFVGGMILIIYGLITYFKKQNKEEIISSNTTIQIPVKNNYIKLFLKGFLLNFINIGVLAFWLGTILIIGPTLDMHQNAIFLYFGIILFTYFSIDLIKIFLAKQLKNRLTLNVTYHIKKIMGIILVICGFFLLLKGFIPSQNIKEFLGAI